MMVEQIDWTVVQRFLGTVWRIALQHNASVTSGCRTSARNIRVGGNPKSKHTFHGGWGMACDLMFDDPTDREPAMAKFRKAGYRPVVGTDYPPEQLHVQGWAFGEEPLWKEV
jgi:hypothetical protein